MEDTKLLINPESGMPYESRITEQRYKDLVKAYIDQDAMNIEERTSKIQFKHFGDDIFRDKQHLENISEYQEGIRELLSNLLQPEKNISDIAF